MNCENQQTINCIIYELEQLKQAVIELESKVNEGKMNNDNKKRTDSK